MSRRNNLMTFAGQKFWQDAGEIVDQTYNNNPYVGLNHYPANSFALKMLASSRYANSLKKTFP